MTTIDPATTRSPCPSWCERRHGAADLDPDGHRGLQWSPDLADDGYWVDIPTVQNLDGDVVVQVKAVVEVKAVVKVKAVVQVKALGG